MKDNEIKELFDFGSFRLDLTDRLLWKDGRLISVPPKVLETLVMMVRHKDRIVSKDELMSAIWPAVFVEENNLNQNISALRKLLGERETGTRYIETIPKRGYRFVAPVAIQSQHECTAERSKDIQSESEPLGGAPASDLPKAPGAQRPRFLRPLLAAICVLCVLALGAVAYKASRTLPTGNFPADAPRSIAVLPFKSLGQSAASEGYLGFGMADTLISRLGANRRVIVRPTSAILKYGMGEQDAAAAGRELGVDAVLEGSIQRLADRVRVTVRLVNPRQGSLIWADKFDESFTDIFRVEDTVTEKVVRSLTPELTGEERDRIAKTYTQNAKAYRLYIIGRYHCYRANPEGWKKAIQYFEEATEEDPKYAVAYAGVADAYVALAADELPQPEAMAKAKQAALRAAEIDPGLAEVHIALGRVRQLFDWDWDGARTEFLHAIRRSPNMADAHREYGAYLVSTGRADEGVNEMRAARQIDPVSLFINFEVGWALVGARRYDEAIAELQKTIAMDPNYAIAHRFLGQAFEQKHMYGEAIAELQTAVRLSARAPADMAVLAHAFARSGRRNDARRLLSELLQTSKARYVSPYSIALVYSGMGDDNSALTWLERAYKERSRRLVGLRGNPAWDNLRQNRRFIDLVQRMRFT